MIQSKDTPTKNYTQTQTHQQTNATLYVTRTIVCKLIKMLLLKKFKNVKKKLEKFKIGNFLNHNNNNNKYNSNLCNKKYNNAQRSQYNK